MATVSKFASTNAVVTTGWTSPTSAYADDGVYATALPGKNLSVTSDFGFAAFSDAEIPVGSLINSVTLEIQDKSNTTSSTGSVIGLQGRIGGALQGAETTQGMSLADQLLTKALTGITESDLKTAGQILARVRGARAASNTAITWSLDYVKITVDYTVVELHSGTVAVSATTATSAGGAKGGKGTVATSMATSVPGPTGSGAHRGTVAASVATSTSGAGSGAHRGVMAVGVVLAVAPAGGGQRRGAAAAISTATSTSAAGKRAASGGTAVPVATAVATAGRKGARGTVSTSVATATSVAGTQERAAAGSVAVAVATSVAVGGRKSAQGTAAVAVATGTTVVGAGGTSGSLSIVASTQATAAGVAQRRGGMFGVSQGWQVVAAGGAQRRAGTTVSFATSVVLGGHQGSLGLPPNLYATVQALGQLRATVEVLAAHEGEGVLGGLGGTLLRVGGWHASGEVVG